MMAAVITPAAAAHRASEAPPLAHDALYGTCATLIIAVLVVFYFDERVRRRLTARVRGYAIGSLGGVIGTGLLIPLLALGGFISDTARVREITFGYTFVFLVAAFGAAIGVWGAEDGARRRATRPAQPPLPAVPAPRAGMTEREHAAEVLGAALAVVSQAHPDVVKANLGRTGAGPEAERLRNLTAAWMALHPPLVAISAGYPSAGVRDRTGAFILAAARAIAHPAALFADTQLLADGKPPQEWVDQGTALYDAVQLAWDALVSALHPGEASTATPARRGRAVRPRRSLASTHRPKWLNSAPGARGGQGGPRSAAGRIG